MTEQLSAKHHLPDRFEVPSPFRAAGFALFLGFFMWSLAGAEISIRDLLAGLPNMGQIASEMVPPATDRFVPMLQSVLVTFQMALVGTVIGVIISIPLAVLAARNLSPAPWVQVAVRGLVSFFRTVPDLAWALFFVVSVGLGPFAGTLTIIVDTIGFCARFFAENMEETDAGPAEAFSAMGAGRLDIVMCTVLPAALPAMTNTTLFALEKAVRSSVVLGLVGAGGIGAELAVSMEMFRYDQAAMIVLMIFVLVLAVERLSSTARKRLIDGR
ncbi:phosphonate ABC transporter, permease protein PhnE [Aestuariispira insulae]|uniref:Phosphonate transport system permease protein n=1 Tax=Aestuariispira insulae TaxID=1461337 RepID=A0A3D9H5T3_9PROT|nr:phosphonate ABC transporter, permease protein PhnE [Aestuariispira insulae]RED44878.1 phosphonate transport system permease protein [Aestuariispira insulae]